MKNGINVISLFDGIACGRQALKKAKIKVDNYYASEVDKYAIQVAKKNHKDIIHIGDVTTINGKLLRKQMYSKVDLLIGGSPCQGFSFAGKQLNFDDPRSKLFFEYVRILKECKPKYFLLENVRMKKEYQDVISKYLGVEPIEINSNLVSAQNRKRLYWTNILNVKQPRDKNILLKDILESTGEPICFSSSGRGNGRVEKRLPSNKKAHTLTSAGYSNRSFTGVLEVRNKSKCVRSGGRDSYDRHEWDSVDNEHKRKLTVVECERLQTLPDNYTEGISNSQRYKCLGNGWTIKVITHILKGIK